MEIASLLKDCLPSLNVENIDTISRIVSPVFTFAWEMTPLTFFSEDGFLPLRKLH